VNGIASQDYRDGAAAGAQILAQRVISVQLMGIVLTDLQIRAMAEEIAGTFGGARLTDGEVREQARVL
jgi:hypothetical protein